MGNDTEATTSPGTRLHRIYDALANQGIDRSMVDTWAAVFGTDSTAPHGEDMVTTCLMALRAEIALASHLLKQRGAPPSLVQPGFDRLMQVSSPGLLHSNWMGQRGTIQDPQCRKVFEWVAWELRDEAESDMPADEMQNLSAELESLEAALHEKPLTPFVHDFVERQINSIRSALRLYGVRGAQPLREALRKVAGDFAVEGSRVQAECAASPEAAGTLAKAGRFVEKTAKVCDQLEKIGKLGDRAVSLAGTVAPFVLPYLASALAR